MRATICWAKNNIAGGEDDPHHGTENEGLHAILKIGDTFLKVPECQYSLNTVSLLENIKNKINGNYYGTKSNSKNRT